MPCCIAFPCCSVAPLLHRIPTNAPWRPSAALFSLVHPFSPLVYNNDLAALCCPCCTTLPRTLRYALDHIPKNQAASLYSRFVAFEKQHGDREGIEDVVVSKRRCACTAQAAMVG